MLGMFAQWFLIIFRVNRSILVTLAFLYRRLLIIFVKFDSGVFVHVYTGSKTFAFEQAYLFYGAGADIKPYEASVG